MRVAVVWDFDAVPWSAPMLGILRGLQLIGHEAIAVPANPGWLSVNVVRRHDPALVLFGLHRALQGDVAAWRAALPTSTALVAWALDDPYDMRTTLETLPHWSAVLTPEPCAVDGYVRRGARCGVLAPTVDDLTYRAQPGGRVAIVRDLLSFAHVNLGPTRAKWLPEIAGELRAAGRRVDDSAGQSRWLVGDELVQALWSSRITLDLPRDQLTTDNPDGVPCTYPGPRVHLAAACAVPCLCIAPRGGLAETYPTALVCERIEHAGDVLLSLTNASEASHQALDRAAMSTHIGFLERHRPEVRARELVRLVLELDPWRWRARGL